MLKFRPYQTEISQEVVSNIRAGVLSQLIQLATGGGKTAIAGMLSLNIAKRLSNRKGCSCLYLVHRMELIDQVRDTLELFGLGDMVGIIQAGHPVSPWGPLQIASVQTLVRRLDKYKWLNPKVIFVDEAHHAMASTWEIILNHFVGAYVIGLTATPERLDGKGLGAHFEVMVEGPSVRQLRDMDFLCATDYFALPKIDLSHLKKTSGGDYGVKKRQESISDKFRADVVDCYLKHCKERRVIHYANSIKDSEDFVERIGSYGIKAAHIDGKTHKNTRKGIIKAFSNGEIDCLSNYEIITEGFDVPDCDAVILARKTASTVLFLQMVGRGRRPKQDGRRAVIIDPVGNIDVHGHPDEDREWSLEDGHIGIQQEKKDVSPFRSCKSCGYVYRKSVSRSCPSCGGGEQRKTVEDIKIELIERKEEEKKEKSTARRRCNREVRASRGDRKKLHEIRAKYGYKPGIITVWERIYEDHWKYLDEQDKMYERQMEVEFGSQ